MTAREFVLAHPTSTVSELVLVGGSSPGLITKLPRYEIDQILKAEGCFVPENEDKALLLAAHAVEIAWSVVNHDKLPPGTIERRRLKFADAQRFWRGCQETGPRSGSTDPERVLAATRRRAAAPLYTLPAKLPKDHPFHPKYTGRALRGNQAQVVHWLRDHPAGGTVEQISDSLLANGFKCAQDPAKAVYFYLNDWVKKGWLARS